MAGDIIDWRYFAWRYFAGDIIDWRYFAWRYIAGDIIDWRGMRQNSSEQQFTPTQFILTKLIATKYIEHYDKTHLLILLWTSPLPDTPVGGDLPAPDKPVSKADLDKVVEVGSQKVDVKKGSIDDVDAVGNRDIGGRGVGNWYSTDSEIKMGPACMPLK